VVNYSQQEQHRHRLITMSSILALTGLLALAAAQQIGKTPEVHPKLPTQLCTTRHGCVTQQTSVVLDALTHSIQNIKTGASCENSTGFPDQTICPNAQACGRNCAIQGINDYSQHGVTVSGNSMTLHQYLNINGTETSVSPRVYLLAPGGQNYDLLKLLNQEFTFTVDVSNLPCGMNGALYVRSRYKYKYSVYRSSIDETASWTLFRRCRTRCTSWLVKFVPKSIFPQRTLLTLLHTGISLRCLPPVVARLSIQLVRPTVLATATLSVPSQPGSMV